MKDIDYCIYCGLNKGSQRHACNNPYCVKRIAAIKNFQNNFNSQPNVFINENYKIEIQKTTILNSFNGRYYFITNDKEYFKNNNYKIRFRDGQYNKKFFYFIKKISYLGEKYNVIYSDKSNPGFTKFGGRFNEYFPIYLKNKWITEPSTGYLNYSKKDLLVLNYKDSFSFVDDKVSKKYISKIEKNIFKILSDKKVNLNKNSYNLDLFEKYRLLL